MAAKKFLTLVSGIQKLLSGVVVSAGAGNDGDLVALDATGKLDMSVLPNGIGADTAAIITSEALSVGDFVNIYDNTGTPTVRKANATDATKNAHGFVKSSYGSGVVATVYREGDVTLSGLTTGSKYFLSTTGGGFTTTPPSATGNVVQYLGTAQSATLLRFETVLPIEIG